MGTAVVTLPDGKQARVTFDTREQLDATVADLSKQHGATVTGVKPPPEPGEQYGIKGFDQLPLDEQNRLHVENMTKFGSRVLSSAKSSLTGIANAAERPLQALKAVPGAVTKGLGKAVGAATHPIETVNKAVNSFDIGTAGDITGTGLVGGGAGKALGVVGDLLGPAAKASLPSAGPMSQKVRDLAKQTTMTLGQRGGKLASTIEQQIAKWPIAGDAIKAARSRSIQERNLFKVNEALADAGGQPVPKTRTTPREWLDHAKSEFTRRYNQVLGNMPADLNAGGPASLATKLGGIRAMVQQGVAAGTMDAKTAAIINDAIDNKVIKRFSPHSGGKASGETLKKIEEDLRVTADGLRRSQDNQQRLAGLAIDQIRNELKAARDLQNPVLSKELSGIDKGYSKYKTAALAANISKKGGGVYSPAQELSAIYRRDKSKDKDAFSRGKAHGQAEAQAAEDVLGNQVADSGTPTGLATLEMLIKKPWLLANIPISLGAHALYSAPVMRMLQRRALRSPGKGVPLTMPAGLAATQYPDTDQAGVAR